MPIFRFPEDDPSGFGGMNVHEITNHVTPPVAPDDAAAACWTPVEPDIDPEDLAAIHDRQLAEYEWEQDHGRPMSEREQLAHGWDPFPGGDPDSVQFKQEAFQRVQAELLAAIHAAYYRRLAECAGADGSSLGFESKAAFGIRKDLALVTKLDKRTVARQIHLVDEAMARFPATWRQFLAGEFPQRNLETVLEEAAGLDPEFLAAFDTVAAVEACDLSVGDLRRTLQELRERLQHDSSVERARLATEGRHVAIEPLPDGQAALTLVGPAHELVALDEAIHYAAIRAVGVGDDPDRRSIPATAYDLAVDVLNAGIQQDACDTGVPFGELGHVRVPHRKGVKVEVLLTIPVGVAAAVQRTDGDCEMAVLTGYGPIDPETARHLTGRAKSWTRVLTDPVTGGLVDIDPRSRYIPPALRRWMQARDPICRCPDCRRSRGDLDHTTAFSAGGPTAPDNLAMLCRPDHGLKHGGYWRVEQLPGGILKWTSVWGTVRYTYPANYATRLAVKQHVDGIPTPF